MYEVVIIRHGQSEWNKSKLFTGWYDASLSEQGRSEAIAAGEKIKKLNMTFTYAYTSMLKRAIGTLWLTLKHSDQMNIPVSKHWQLNERHYGSLQGKNKDEMRAVHGEDQVHQWRRNYTTIPPLADAQEVPTLYKGLEAYPRGESLENTYQRVSTFWESEIKEKVRGGDKVIIAAHGNSLRALVKHLEGISDSDIVGLEIPTGQPISIKLDKDFNFINREFL